MITNLYNYKCFKHFMKLNSENFFTEQVLSRIQDFWQNNFAERQGKKRKKAKRKKEKGKEKEGKRGKRWKRKKKKNIKRQKGTKRKWGKKKKVQNEKNERGKKGKKMKCGEKVEVEWKVNRWNGKVKRDLIKKEAKCVDEKEAKSENDKVVKKTKWKGKKGERDKINRKVKSHKMAKQWIVAKGEHGQDGNGQKNQKGINWKTGEVRQNYKKKKEENKKET